MSRGWLRSYALLLGLGPAAGCRNSGSGTEPPAQEDPANPEASIPDYQPSTNVFEVSAFEGEELDASGHQHGGHGGHGKAPKGEEHGGHEGHVSQAAKVVAGSEATR